MTDHTGEDVNIKREPGPMYEVSRRILLAAIGAVALAQEEVEDIINRLVDRGEIAEKDGRQLVKEMLEKRRERRKYLETKLNRRFHDTMERLDVPTKKDIDDLSVKIAELTKKVEELNKSKDK